MPTPLTWPLAAEETPDTPGSDASTPPGTAEAAPLTFLGFGPLRPFRRDQKADFANGGDRALLRARVGQILGTRALSVVGSGELPWRGAFGSRLHLLRHRNRSEGLIQMAEAMIREALERWEPNVNVLEVEEVDQTATRRVSLRVHYEIIGADLLPDSVDVPFSREA